jgi:hypothetical protein
VVNLLERKTVTCDEHPALPRRQRRGRHKWLLFGPRKQDKISQLKAQELKKLALAADMRPEVSDTTRKRAARKARVLHAKWEYLDLLDHRHNWNWPVISPVGTVLKFAIGMASCIFIGSLAVSGVYDTLWELPIPIKLWGAAVALVGLTIAGLGVESFFRNRQRGRSIASPIVAMVIGAVILYFSARAWIAILNHPHWKEPSDLWHYLVPDKVKRHLLYRKEPEGLVGGLLAVYWFWKAGVKGAKNYKWFYRPLQPFSVPGDDKDAVAWKFWVMPALAILAALPVWIGGYYLLIRHHNDATVSHWIHDGIPWHSNLFPAATNTDMLSRFVGSITLTWPAAVIGFISARFWGRAPAAGPVEDAQKVAAWTAIARHDGRRPEDYPVHPDRPDPACGSRLRIRRHHRQGQVI